MFTQFRTEGFNGYSLKWSPFFENKLAVATASNFGLVGNGRLFIINMMGDNITVERGYDTQDGLFDVAWSEINENQLWSPQAPRSLQTYTEHTHCVYSTSWSPYNPTMLASASGDQTIKIWDTKSPRSMQTIRAHHNEILSLDWNKYQEHMLATGSVDKTIKVWDLRRPDREAKYSRQCRL
ncbi:hypothetical protein RMCBS344292_00132 [Rhizopus microsporus]|nr:hypothetical protein RMCBS344292_00132 [Rhizopus microsporus]